MRIRPLLAIVTVIALSGLLPAVALAQVSAANVGAGQDNSTTSVKAKGEDKKEIASMKAVRLGEYLSRHVAVLKGIIARLESRITKIETRGLSAEGQKKLESAKKNIAEAKTKIDSVGTAVATVISDVEKALSGDDIKAGLAEARAKIKNPRTLLADAIAKIKDARKDIGDALGTVTTARSATTTQTATSSTN